MNFYYVNLHANSCYKQIKTRDYEDDRSDREITLVKLTSVEIRQFIIR